MINIGPYKVKNFEKPFIVAEVGVNHNGNLKTALRMIDVAKKSGCHAVKFQTFKAKEIVQDQSLKFTYFTQGKKISESMYKMFKRYELKEKNWKIISNYCRKKKIIFFSTPQNISDLNILKKLNVPAIKVGSDDFTNVDLIKNYLKHKIPLILSTGMSTKDDIKRVLNIKGISKKKVIFLLCTSEYPTNHESVNINKFNNLKKILKNYSIGFSDHTKDDIASIMAVTHGCCFFEKHFTLNNNLKGPDHWFSMNPSQLKNWVKSINDAYKCLGSNKLIPTKKEKINKVTFQRKIVAKNDIKKGKIILDTDIMMLRIDNKMALNAYDVKKIIGKKAKKYFKIGEAII
jgi:N,N'-diacetyllegionaminate synthase